jgi:hypothetical protein
MWVCLMAEMGQSRQGGASCRSNHVRNAPLATLGPKKAACHDGPTAVVSRCSKDAPRKARHNYLNDLVGAAEQHPAASYDQRRPAAERNLVTSSYSQAGQRPAIPGLRAPVVVDASQCSTKSGDIGPTRL